MSEPFPKLSRNIWTCGTGILIQLLKDDLALAKLIKQRKYKELYAAALVAHYGPSPRTAVTDPAQFTALQRARTLFFIKGYRCLDCKRLQKLVEATDAA